MNTRKGISPLVSTLLLIAIAVAASVLTYSWIISMVSSQSAQAQTQVRIESVTWEDSDGAATGFTLGIRNTGSVAADIESVSIRENKSGANTISTDMEDSQISFLSTAPKDNLLKSISGQRGASDDAAGLVIPPTAPSDVDKNYDVGVFKDLALEYDWAPNAIMGTSYVIRVTTTTGFYYESVFISPSQFATSNQSILQLLR